jgi:tetratricopeptide (TPR) repeat protein
MRKFFLLLLISSAFIVKYSFSQKTLIYQGPEADYRCGLDLFNNEKYSAAQKVFEGVINQDTRQKTQDTKEIESELRTNSEYYYAICASRLFNEDAETLLTDFINNHKENAKVKLAYFELAKYQYAKKSYSKAIQSFLHVDPTDLSNVELSEYYFKSGYSNFRVNKFDEAANAFNEIKNKDNKYQKPALYYYSHVAYTKKNYQTALEGFQKLIGDGTFGPFVPYYIAQIYYLQKKYDELIRFALPILDSAKAQRGAEIAHLLADSYFRTNRFKESIPYMLKYREKSETGVTREDDYQLAYIYYKSAEHSKAVKLFEKVAVKDDSLTQNSNYHVADCYLKLSQK